MSTTIQPRHSTSEYRDTDDESVRVYNAALVVFCILLIPPTIIVTGFAAVDVANAIRGIGEAEWWCAFILVWSQFGGACGAMAFEASGLLSILVGLTYDFVRRCASFTIRSALS
jgi:hypothetical protein